VYDVVVIGGGATGSGVALDASSRGLKVACVERGDFASETSSRSTKLIWAGIRYLGTAAASLLSAKNLFRHPLRTVREFVDEFQMVLHCHKERRYMTTTQRHLCHWMPIAVPFREWLMTESPPMGHPLFALFPVLAPFVFKFYDALSGFSCPSSYLLTRKRALEVFPQLDSANLLYCAVFYEAMHNDARTNLAIALTAAEKGACIANYVEAIGLVKDEGSNVAKGVLVRDRISKRTWPIRANKVVLAGGPFTDELRKMETATGPTTNTNDNKHSPAVKGAAGTHLVLPGYFLPKNLGLLDPNTSDGRFMFILPWMGHTLVGTTDRPSDADTLPEPPEEDIDWILNECQRYLSPDLRPRRSHVLSAWTGWRPLAVDPHAPPDAPVSRDHVISENPETGTIFIAGGKWTTWRQMAEEVTDRLVGPNGPPSRTLAITLHGGGTGYSSHLPYQLVHKYDGMDQDVAEHLVSTYGDRAWEVCELAKPVGSDLWPRFGTPVVDGFPIIDAEVRYACREYACTLEDVLCRRTRLAFLNKQAAIAAITKVADIMAQELGWTEDSKMDHMKSARIYLETYGGRNPIKTDKLLRIASLESPDRLFAALDRDANGSIDIHEVAEAVSILGLSFSDNEVKRVFEDMDERGRGEVNVDRFKEWWTHKFKGSVLYKQMVNEVEKRHQ